MFSKLSKVQEWPHKQAKLTHMVKCGFRKERARLLVAQSAKEDFFIILTS